MDRLSIDIDNKTCIVGNSHRRSGKRKFESTPNSTSFLGSLWIGSLPPRRSYLCFCIVTMYPPEFRRQFGVIDLKKKKKSSDPERSSRSMAICFRFSFRSFQSDFGTNSAAALLAPKSVVKSSFEPIQNEIWNSLPGSETVKRRSPRTRADHCDSSITTRPLRSSPLSTIVLFESFIPGVTD